MAWAPTTDQVLDTRIVRRRADTWRFELLDRDETPIGALHPDLDSPPVIANDGTSDVPRTLTSLHLTTDQANDVDHLSDRLRVWMVLQNGDEFSMGIFLWGNDIRPQRPWGPERESNLVDKMHILNQGIMSPRGWQEGAATSWITIHLLNHAGITTQEIIAGWDPMYATLGSAVAYEPGSQRSSIIREMTEFNGFLPPWFDRNGKIRLMEPPELSLTRADIVYDNELGIVADSIVEDDDLLDAPNRIVIYETSGTRTVRGSYRFPASAPHSSERRGFRIVRAESKQGLKTPQQAQKMARNLARTNMETFERVAFQSTANPLHDTWDVVEFRGENWLEERWQMTCRSGEPMSHLLRRELF